MLFPSQVPLQKCREPAVTDLQFQKHMWERPLGAKVLGLALWEETDLCRNSFHLSGISRMNYYSWQARRTEQESLSRGWGFFLFVEKCQVIFFSRAFSREHHYQSLSMLWADLLAPRRYMDALTPRTSELDLIWKYSLYRGNRVKMSSSGWALIQDDW